MSAGPNDFGAHAARERPNLLADQRLPSPPQQERSRRARDGLLGASLALFGENGYEATTVDEIARRAGVAVGGFYLHFRSKRQVLLVLMDLLLLGVESRLAALGDPAELPERLLAGMHFDSPYAGVYRAWREAALRDGSIAALDAEVETWMSSRIAAALRTMTGMPGARSTVDIHAFAWMLSVLWWRLIENLRLDRDALAKTATAIVQFVLFEDRALSGDLQPLPSKESS